LEVIGCYDSRPATGIAAAFDDIRFGQMIADLSYLGQFICRSDLGRGGRGVASRGSRTFGAMAKPQQDVR
jgi:hypothetical protein